MKKVLFIIVLLIANINLYSQSLSVFDVDASNFPIMKAKFFAFDATEKQIKNLSPGDFQITEEGIERTVRNVRCSNASLPPVSSVLVFDVSASMIDGPPRIQSAKNAANAWIDGLPTPNSECALISFDNFSILLQDFTTDRNKIKGSIEKLVPVGATNYNQALIDEPCGGLQIAKNGKHKKVVIFLTDGQPNLEPRTQEIINFANQNNIVIYAVTLDMPAPLCIKNITAQTGGQYFENITTIEEAEKTYQKLLRLAIGIEPCEIEWESESPCFAGYTNAIFKLLPFNISSNVKYPIQNSSIAKIEVSPSYILFQDPPLGVKTEQKIKLTARMSDFNISNIALSNNLFDINPKNFYLKKNESIELSVSYTPTEKGYNYCKLEFLNDKCISYFYISGGYKSFPPTKKTLSITEPSAGDKYVIGSDSIITWEGVPDNDSLKLEYSIDDGLNWIFITDKASGLRYDWKNLPQPAATNCKIRGTQLSKGNASDDTGNLQLTLVGHTDYAWQVIWGPKGDIVATAGFDGSCMIWDAVTGDLLHTLNEHSGYVYSIAFSPDGSRLASASDDGTCVIWDVNSGNMVNKLIGHSGPVHHIEWSPDGNRLATASDDKTGIIWEANSGSIIFKLTGHSSKVKMISWNHNGTRIATASDDRSCIIWDANLGSRVFLLTGHGSIVDYLAWSPDDSQIATASLDNTCKIWNSFTGDNVFTLNGHTEYVRYVSWNTNGSKLATASWDNTTIIWDANNGNNLATLYGHSDVVYQAVWSPDGSKIATASWDKKAIIWDPITGNKLQTLLGHIEGVYHVSWNPEGSRIATASNDMSARIWYVVGTKVQEAESEVFSIVEPLAQAKDIDMGVCEIGTVKEIFENNFTSNIGSWKIRIDDIYLEGADKDAFSVVSGLPVYEIEPGESKHIELKFIPNRVGEHNAVIVIVTQAGTLRYNIKGEGVYSQVEILSDFLDFGQFEIGQEKIITDEALIKNSSTNTINFNAAQILGPDLEQFEIISGGEAFTLQPGETHKMTLKFKVKYGGRTSGRIGFEYVGGSSPAVVRLFGTGIGGTVKIPNDSAFPGEQKLIQLVLERVKPEGLSKLASSFEAKLRFQKTILAPSENLQRDYSLDSVIVSVSGNIGSSEILAEVPVIAALGSVTETWVELLEVKLFDESGNQIDYDLELEPGLFKILGICEDGGQRLINTEGEVIIKKISPNPSDGNINIEINLIESGKSIVSIINEKGEVIETREIIDSKGINSISLDARKYSSGLYFINLETPTLSIREKFVVVK